ncbi:N-acetyltransferas-like protein 9 [Amylocarpus encephaloides]|uniref:N-acetyltransferas-like protein 9 n=1 Tax=Amylocarpus encephaloides TaxID=45428 RepID=A0A9P8CA51_9HELO|nr:N-acetyltransferas-like protein 9 [Amylocarpus encephaloides]
MRCNETTAVSLKDRIILVPYEAAHVTTYHEWMKDPAIQASTASEPLALPEEHAMQQSWRTSHDKLTFIICLPLPLLSPSLSSPLDTAFVLKGGIDDSPSRMVGDVNLFIYDNCEEDDEEDDEKEKKQRKPLVGELELMIAPTAQRRQGYGRSALLAFLHYILKHLDEILATYYRGAEWSQESREEKPRRGVEKIQFKVKIGEDNTASLRLFESLGFVKARETANYFGEFEMDLADPVVEMWSQGIPGKGKGGESPLGEGYAELTYAPFVTSVLSKVEPHGPELSSS